MKATLNYHRRHGLNCDGRHAAGTYSSEPEERKKGYKRCKCLIYASGSLNREAKRFATKLCDWQAAADLMAPYIAANSWSLVAPPTQPLPEMPQPAGDGGDSVPLAAPGKRALMADAILAFNSEYANASWKTRKGVEYSANELLAFAENHGLRYVHEWTPALVRDLRASWVFRPRSKGQQRPLRAVMTSTAKKKLALAKRFFEFCLEGEWAIRNPAHIKPPRGKRRRDMETVGRQRLPYSDVEIEWMYEWCQRYGAPRLSPAPGRPLKWTGADLSDFIAISIYTGMRISDVVTFHIDRLRDNGEVRIRTIKSQGDTEVCSWVPEWLAQIIRNRARKFGPYIFGAHPTEKIDGITDPWRERLNALWAQIGEVHPWKAKPEHHRFRHTFARILLQRGTPVPDVANLLGNTEAVVRKYYRAWVPELQARTTEILREAFANTPRPDQPRRVKVRAIG